MICIDQSTGEKNTEPLTVLASALHGKINFGIYLRLENRASDSTHLDKEEPLIPIC